MVSRKQGDGDESETREGKQRKGPEMGDHWKGEIWGRSREDLGKIQRSVCEEEREGGDVQERGFGVQECWKGTREMRTRTEGQGQLGVPRVSIEEQQEEPRSEEKEIVTEGTHRTSI